MLHTVLFDIRSPLSANTNRVFFFFNFLTKTFSNLISQNTNEHERLNTNNRKYKLRSYIVNANSILTWPCLLPCTQHTYGISKVRETKVLRHGRTDVMQDAEHRKGRPPNVCCELKQRRVRAFERTHVDKY